jgi:SAM-dependent methyltransferase
MSFFYKLAYLIGMTPWEEMETLPIAQQANSLLDREESERTPPLGAALDIGCGSGIWSAKLAARGWQVTGVDIVPKAIHAARRRIREAGVEAQLIRGDITALHSAGVGTGFQFVLDFGAIHGLSDAQRVATGREITSATEAGSTMLMLVWVPASRGPLPRGMTRGDIEASFPAWKIVDELAAEVSGAPDFVKKAQPRFYRLRRD